MKKRNSKAPKPYRKPKLLIGLGIMLLLLGAGLVVADQLWTQMDIDKHNELGDGRTPPVVQAKPTENTETNTPQTTTIQPGQTLDPETDSDPNMPAATPTPTPSSAYAMLDPLTRESYDAIRARYLDFQGWIDIPAFQISYPLFVDETNVAKYERHNRDGQLSKMGEVGFVGDPVDDYNFIIYGHSLSNRQKGFQPIDNYPDFQVSEDQRRIFVDIYETGERREYRVVASRYYANGDNPWFRYRFNSKEEHSEWFKQMTGYREDVDQTLIVYTCKNSSRTWHSVLFCVPVT